MSTTPSSVSPPSSSATAPLAAGAALPPRPPHADEPGTPGRRGPFSRIARFLRLITALAAVFLVVWAFTWVGTRPFRKGLRPSGQVELTVMHWAGGGGQREEQIVSSMIADFERAHPHVRVKRINPGDAATFYTKLQTMMAAGVPPDVFYVGNERVASFADHGLLYEVEPLLAADEQAGRATLNLADFYQATLDCFRFDGRATGRGPLYGIPKDFTPVGFYYNRDLFRKAGVPEPSDDWTWDDFHAAAQAIGRLPGCTGGHIVSWPAMLRVYLWTEGAEIIDDDFRTVRADDVAVIAALERLAGWRFHERNTLTGSSLQVTIEDSVLLSGNLGMAGPFGRWVVPTYRQIRDFEWDFAPLPRGKQRANAVFTVAWSISRQTRHPNEAWELVKHLTGPEGQRQTALSGLALPTMRSVAESGAFLDPSVKPDRDRSYLVAAEYARAMQWPPTSKFEDLLKGCFERCVKTGLVPVPVALADFARAWSYETSTPLAQRDYPRMPWGAIALSIATPLGLLLLIGAALWWRGRPGRLEGREELAGLACMSPWLIGFALFTAFPLVLSLLLSFTKWNGTSTLDAAEWVGLGNLQQMILHDERFANALWVTVFYAALAVPATQIFALLAAVLMAQEVRGIGFFRSAWYLPSVLAGVGVAVLWRWIFDDHGLLNVALQPAAHGLSQALNWGADALGSSAHFDLVPPRWLAGDAGRWGPPAFAIMALWTIGGSMMIYLAGLKGVPSDLYEAASIDGASRWRRLWAVTLPMLSPVIFFNVVMAIIGSFQVFVQSFVMTSGGPGDATRFYVLYLYNQAFDFHEMGYASAMAWLLLLIVLALTLLVMRGSRRFVHYEGLRV